MNYLIIKSHPYSGSFNAGVAATIYETVSMKGHNVTEIDLLSDGFNPVMTAEDLEAWKQGQTLDPLIKKYQNQIDDADILVFPFPVWWGGPPAILKGFCDKILLYGWAYKLNESGKLVGMLNSKKAIVIATSEVANEIIERNYRNPVEGAFVKNTLGDCGIEVIKHMYIDKISSDRDYAENKMAEIREMFSA
ncbi:MAG: NAD(P)H-dependent oxidoreductase [Oscillospiraceae bacterium]|nr:NAD(P)H-dependent oxidoreductase [Oscillospiraceae bacterium]